MKIKTSELKGTQLDWAVAKCEGIPLSDKPRGHGYFEIHSSVTHANGRYGREIYAPSNSWSQGGPVIEREGIHLRSIRSAGHILNNSWLAKKANGNTGQIEQWYKTLFNKEIAMWYGSTPLEAAMRCYVASKLGDEVEIPEKLV